MMRRVHLRMLSVDLAPERAQRTKGCPTSSGEHSDHEHLGRVFTDFLLFYHIHRTQAIERRLPKLTRGDPAFLSLFCW